MGVNLKGGLLSGQVSSSHIRILLVEDDEVDYMIANRLLKKAYGNNFDLHWSDSATKAMTELVNSEFDVCLIDYNLEGTNGIELLTRMNNAGHKNVPKILLTGLESYEVDSKATEAGATDYLVKNQLQPEQLERSIRYSLKQKEIEKRVNYLGLHDVLTDLANRALLEEHLERAISSSSRYKEYSAVLFIDLDDFKSINDSLGHSIGDLLLVEAAKRLKLHVRHEDIVSRFGGDEFVILLNRLHKDKAKAREQVVELAEKMRQLLAEPLVLENSELRTSASIGATLFCDEDTDCETILKQADIAMYRSKGEGRDKVSLFESSMEVTVQSNYWVQNGLRAAIIDNQLQLHYQPIIALKTGKIIGAEALIRWYHPEKGVIPPIQFIPNIEETDLMAAVGNVVLNNGCKFLYEHPQLEYLSVNIGRRHFENPGFAPELVAVLSKYQVKPERLIIELTESLFLKNPQSSREKMKQIKSLGVRFALDDFGTGFSSLSALKDLPIDIIKIDQSFTRCIGEEPSGEAIVVAIINMSDALGLKVIAEGVEEKKHDQFMLSKNCYAAQGYYYNRPATAQQFIALLNDH